LNKLEIHDLTKAYGEKIALDHFSYVFTPGISAILGPNGAGKTTLMNLICDVCRRQEGEILYNGTDILKLGRGFRNVLGFMPQSQGMYESMTAYDFLAYIADLKGLRARRAAGQIKELLELVNLSSAAHQKVGGFSGGMRQRVMLAQAMLGEPEVLLLDEPTAGLDPEERVRLRTYIEQLGKDKIVLITTHITSDVESIADQILLLHGGKLQYSAPAEEFIQGCGCDTLEDAYLKRLHAL
jgi:ABC-type multidrug transport system ATPase subunit